MLKFNLKIEYPNGHSHGKPKGERWEIFESAGEYAKAMAGIPCYSSHATGTSWVGGKTYQECIEGMATGDLSLVAKSDKLMSQLEDKFKVQSSKFVNVLDVAGGFANVPAYLAGIPTNMVRRQRVASEQGPLTICVDITSSGGVDASKLMKRGTAILALVRLLATRRPISLWIMTNLDTSEHGVAICQMVKVETAPLDLARAAYMLCHVSVARSLMYSKASKEHGSSLTTPYNTGWESWRTIGAERCSAALGGQEVLFIPPTFLHDPIAGDATGWLEEMLKKYGGDLIE